MLQNIREHAQGWIATVIGIMLSIAFALWGIEYYLSGNKKDLAAKVNGREITNREVNFDFQRLSNHLVEQFGKQILLNTNFQESVKKQALQNIITREVLIQGAQHAGFLIGMPQISATIQQIPEFQDQGQFSIERFQHTISNLGYSINAFIEDLRQSILINQFASGIIGSEFSLQNEVDEAIQLAEQKRDLFYTIIPASRFTKELHPSQKEITSYYQEHKNDFIIPAKVQIDYIEIFANDLKKNLKVSETEIQDYYQSTSNKNSLSEEKGKIVQALLQQKMEQAFSSLNDKIADLAFTNPNSLEPIASNLNLKIKTSEFFTQDGGKLPILKNSKVLAAAFNQEAINSRTNSNIIEIEPGHIVVVRVNDYQAETVEPLSSVDNKIVSLLKTSLAKVKTKEFGEQLVNEINKQSSNPMAYLKNKHLGLIEKYKISRMDKAIPSEILSTAFSIPANTKSMKGLSLNNGDYVIVGVNKIMSYPKNAITQTQREDYRKSLTDNYGKLEYSLYLQNKVQAAKIKYFNK